MNSSRRRRRHTGVPPHDLTRRSRRCASRQGSSLRRERRCRSGSARLLCGNHLSSISSRSHKYTPRHSRTDRRGSEIVEVACRAHAAPCRREETRSTEPSAGSEPQQDRPARGPPMAQRGLNALAHRSVRTIYRTQQRPSVYRAEFAIQLGRNLGEATRVEDTTYKLGGDPLKIGMCCPYVSAVHARSNQ